MALSDVFLCFWKKTEMLCSFTKQRLLVSNQFLPNHWWVLHQVETTAVNCFQFCICSDHCLQFLIESHRIPLILNIPGQSSGDSKPFELYVEMGGRYTEGFLLLGFKKDALFNYRQVNLYTWNIFPSRLCLVLSSSMWLHCFETYNI